MLRQILLLQRDVPKAVKFYQEGLGLPVKVLTERWAELDAGTTTLALKAVEGFVSLAVPLPVCPEEQLMIPILAQGGLLQHWLHTVPIFHSSRLATNSNRDVATWGHA